MAQNKTVETNASVAAYFKKIKDSQRKADCESLARLMSEISGFESKLWGTAIVGFGSYHYKYESGHEGDAPLVGFSPRKSEFALYIANFEGKEELLKQFGKHKTAKACVYIKKMEDINESILKKLVTGAVKYMKAKYK